MKAGEPYSKEDFDAAVQFKIRFEKVQGALVQSMVRDVGRLRSSEWNSTLTTPRPNKDTTSSLANWAKMASGAHTYVFVVVHARHRIRVTNGIMLVCYAMICRLLIARRQLNFYTLGVHRFAAASR